MRKFKYTGDGLREGKEGVTWEGLRWAVNEEKEVSDDVGARLAIRGHFQEVTIEPAEFTEVPVKKKRGRPRKNPG